MKIDEVIQQPGMKERMLKENILKSLRVAIPGEVVSYDSTQRTAVIQPVIREWGCKEDPPLLLDVPVYMWGNFTFTPTKGDGCLVVCADSCIDAWIKSGGVSSPVVARNHSLSDGFAFVGFRQTGGTDLPVKLNSLDTEIADIYEKIGGLPDIAQIVQNLGGEGKTWIHDAELNNYIHPGVYYIGERCKVNGVAASEYNYSILYVIGGRPANNVVQYYYLSDGTSMVLREFRSSTWKSFTDVNKIVNNLTSTSTSSSLSANQGKVLNDGKLDKQAAEGLGIAKGLADYSYCKLLTITIPHTYYNRPIAIEISGRGKWVTRLHIMFKNTGNTDPGLDGFYADVDSAYYIYKAGEGVWEIYGPYAGSWGEITIHRILGLGANSVQVTVANVNSIPATAVKAVTCLQTA